MCKKVPEPKVLQNKWLSFGESCKSTTRMPIFNPFHLPAVQFNKKESHHFPIPSNSDHSVLKFPELSQGGISENKHCWRLPPQKVGWGSGTKTPCPISTWKIPFIHTWSFCADAMETRAKWIGVYQAEWTIPDPFSSGWTDQSWARKGILVFCFNPCAILNDCGLWGLKGGL